MALLGLPGYVSASGATPLVAVMQHKGLSAGAGMAFLLTGPAANATTLTLLSTLHSRRLALLFAALVCAVATLLGLAVNQFFGAAAALPLHHAAVSRPTLLQAVSLALVGLLMLASLLRQGPRGMLGHVLAPHGALRRHSSR